MLSGCEARRHSASFSPRGGFVAQRPRFQQLAVRIGFPALLGERRRLGGERNALATHQRRGRGGEQQKRAHVSLRRGSGSSFAEMFEPGGAHDYPAFGGLPRIGPRLFTPLLQGVAAEARIVALRVVQVEVKASTFLPTSRCGNDERGGEGQIPQLDQVGGQLEVPVVLVDFMAQQVDPTLRSLESPLWRRRSSTVILT